MDEYYRVVRQLPECFSQRLVQLAPQDAGKIQEIRLRLDQPVQFTVGGKLMPAAAFLGGQMLGEVDAQTLQACFLQLCDQSVYAHERELKNGYITLPGGHRVGVAGSWQDGYFSCVTSLNLRIARWVTCAVPESVKHYLEKETGGLLVAGVPGSGKTTFLRTLARWLSVQNKVVCVVDERGELMAGGNDGIPGAERIPCDVYTYCPKSEGVLMALRCMNPQYIVCDELGTTAEAAAVEQGLASGVCFLASVHCACASDLFHKPQTARLIQTGAFGGAAFLKGRAAPGVVSEWVDLPCIST